MRAGRTVGGQCQDLRAKSGEHALVLRNAILVEDIEVVDKCLVGVPVVRGRLGMTRADPQQEEAVGRVQQVVDDAQLAAGGAADPDCAVPQLLELLRDTAVQRRLSGPDSN